MITALQLPDHTETMIVDLMCIYSPDPLLNVVYCGWLNALALKSATLNREYCSQIIHYTYDIWYWFCHGSILFVDTKKEKTEKIFGITTHKILPYDFLLSLICHQLCLRIARGYNVQINPN